MAATTRADMTVDIKNFVGGAFVDPADGQYMDSYCPATGKVVGKLPLSTKTDVDAAVDAAKAAFPVWSGMTATERSNIMLKVAELVEGRLEEFAFAESFDQGKPVSLARAIDIPRVVSNFRFFATAILHHEEMSTMTDRNGLNYTIRSPVGVCGLISPWNLPLYLLSWKIAPAICVGNTVVCKPSEFTSLTAHMLCGVLNDAGVPPGVVNMVFGDGAGAGEPLVSHPDVPLISFTGGTATGLRISQSAAPFYKKLSLELGGKNPNIIFADADLDVAVPTTVKSSFANQGEICLCGSRIFVQDSIYDEFLERFVAESAKLVVGDPTDPNTTTGALVSEQHLQKVLSYIEEIAPGEGANIVLGGDRPTIEGECADGYFVNPTIITDLAPDCRTATEEIFGPVVTVHRFTEESEVIEYANSSKYGLSASVWTQNITRAHRVAGAIQSGTVWVNCWLHRDLRVPFGGMKESGIGREGGAFSVDFYTEHKNVCIQL